MNSECTHNKSSDDDDSDSGIYGEAFVDDLSLRTLDSLKVYKAAGGKARFAHRSRIISLTKDIKANCCDEDYNLTWHTATVSSSDTSSVSDDLTFSTSDDGDWPFVAVTVTTTSKVVNPTAGNKIEPKNSFESVGLTSAISNTERSNLNAANTDSSGTGGGFERISPCKSRRKNFGMHFFQNPVKTQDLTPMPLLKAISHDLAKNAVVYENPEHPSSRRDDITSKQQEQREE